MSRDSLHRRLLDISEAVGGPLLAFDTSGTQASICTVAWREGQVEELELPADAMPSEALADTLASTLSSAGIAVSELKALIIGIGPGSFTGLRVGLATAKGLALGAGTPLYGVSSLAMLAAGSGPGSVAPVLDARRNEVFAALYDVDAIGRVTSRIEDAAWSPTEFAERLARDRIGRVTLVGAGAPTCFASSPPPETEVVAAATARAAFGILHAEQRIRAGAGDPIDALAPRYMKASEAERQRGQPGAAT